MPTPARRASPARQQSDGTTGTADPSPPKPPLHCYWVHEPDGTRWLVPGCVARLHDADADACTCPTLAEQLATAQHERDEARKAHRGLRDWADSIIATVYAHPDGKKIMKEAAERAEKAFARPDGGGPRGALACRAGS